MSMTDQYSGALTVHDDSENINAIAFLVSQMMGELWTVCVVQVISCTNAGGVSPVGTVNVQPMVAMIDGQNNTTQHGIISNLPYVRIQGGANAIIIDPAPGDIGISLHATRDISTVKDTKALSPPGSRRRFDAADGIYLGGSMNAAPTQYVAFASGGITVVSPTLITLQAPTVHVQGSLTVSGSITAIGDVTGDGTSLHTHVHAGVTTGSGDTGPPV